MSETDDQVRLLPADEQATVKTWGARIRLVGKYAVVLAGALGSSVATYRYAVGDAATRTQVTEDKAKSGYLKTAPAVEGLQKDVADLKSRIRVLEAQQHPPARRGSRPRALPAPAAAAQPPRPLPANLDEAYRQVYKGAPLAPAPVDAGTKRGE